MPVTRRLVPRIVAASLIFGGVAGSVVGCSTDTLLPGFESPATPTTRPIPAPAPETKTPNVDSGFSTYWMLLPGGKEKVLCYEHAYDGDPRYNHVNGVAADCDWNDKQPVAGGDR
ncbi:Uncharacterised protein [Mycobacteroides abscessus]|uniref:hypothetical protein n=1 Tax=Mycobacteroides abscessus TaxID=36809 RepID=UPI0005DA836F|nr:hypothetical protein [Mycobacteroides abscessus]CPR73989.1 Uncharacterised protein [Mycobacteroides abscessus]CPU57801.1 Uncharacterised protein [Mycobacteroides abscessus]CPU61599.1 Uncharacterised protein [Mycobacteroides abscessus]CPU61853.1 Uncharacterised protein [Mycobacteroides abscessus]CPV40876.1 Uncharacterised protein [Mycobacteroides abscessus]